MFVIDVTLKNNPLAVSVERKSEEDAKATYQKVVDILTSGSSQLVELTCDRQTEKKIAILSSEISAVQVSEKTGSTSGKTPGFFAISQ
ncbi:hypothetical protein H6G20_26430 [Desertifilum sp. FACHB-1129]|uniref:Uncharacterized protein n=2 Tax=Desertifilum tharense IPPAS B-1220 TaxID=1781255 RepID=A0A1E5QD10_9CYAN|nr:MULTISPECIES: hypothetical protein [Desertifilum]MCD8490244.1 hypothetical protein [Desertifilum sp.]MDA0211533.1 hypothetical protein [Cyanobacteria bacterium FC1]MBD2315208.1 hypothetical protein [Desertifilum sp. FACHB-1129]MBD2322139.1 hypothetical protein [Desertifilum sp. FACHB-866]MBD2332176.1 hypothetical protein [Desertifilum sp. FACHB-868]